MSKTIQLSGVPDELHRRLMARAAMAHISLSEYLLAEIKEIAERPTVAELSEELRKQSPVVQLRKSRRAPKAPYHLCD